MANCDSAVCETPHRCLCCRTQVMHIAAVSEITNLLIPSLKTLHVSSASRACPSHLHTSSANWWCRTKQGLHTLSFTTAT